jgi:hypothetical protein
MPERLVDKKMLYFASPERDGRTLQRLEEPHDKRYQSIFGELMIARSVYGTREPGPLDEPP